MKPYPTSKIAVGTGPEGTAADGLRVEGQLTINDVAGWHCALKERAAAGIGLVMDLSGVTAADAIGIQLLCAAKRTAAARGLEYRLVGAGPVLRRVCEGAGIDLSEAGLS